LVPISTLPDDYYIHDEIRHQLVGERTRKVFRLGDNVTIRIMEANTISGGLMLELAGQPARKHDIETSGGDLAGHMPLKRRSSQRRGGHPPGGKGRHSSHHRGQHNEDEGNRKPHAKSTAAKAKPKSKRRGKPTGKRGKPSFHKKG
jgi:ribonuclease R